MLAGLNAPQREAVLSTEGPWLVIAGAGSGKTRVLTTRIAHLIRELDVPPEAILAFTFTNKAAREMRGRVEREAPQAAGRCWIGTFHATGVRILRREAHRLGYPNSFTIYDAVDTRSLMVSILKDLRADPKQFPPRAAASEISRLKNAFVSVAQARESALTHRDEKRADVYEEYERRLRTNGAMDFDDLIGRTVQLFEEHPQVQQRYSDRFRYVLVDEFQDTNPLQLVMIRALSASHGNLFAVGDDDQSIYSWRGATVDNMLKFEDYFPGSKLLRLEQNYRSTSIILNAANTVISNNRRRKGKTLWTEQTGGDLIELRWADDGDDEAGQIRDTIRHLGNEGVPRREMVILYRTNAQSRSIEDALRREGIPYQIIGGTRFFERREVKDLLAYLRVLANPADSISLARIINVPRRGVGKASVEKLYGAAAAAGISPLELCKDTSRLASTVGTAPAKRLYAFARLIEDLGRLAQSRDAVAVFKQLMAAIKYEDWIRKDDPSTAEERLENVAELGNAVHSFVSETDDGTLAEFLESVTLLADIDRLEESGDMVTLMTMHTAKGLEFPYVFVAGCEEGLLPHMTSLQEDDGVEEERRLFYVALTRAERRLFLSSAASRQRFGSYEPMLPSRFLGELPDDCYTEVGLSTRPPMRSTSRLPSAGPRRHRPVSRSDEPAAWDNGFSVETFRRSQAQAKSRASDPDHGFEEHEWNQEEIHFAPGLRVKHEKLGEGTIEVVEGFGDLTRLTIDFADAGKKKVLAKYAKIQVVGEVDGP